MFSYVDPLGNGTTCLAQGDPHRLCRAVTGSKALVLMSTLAALLLSSGGWWPVHLIQATGWLVLTPNPALTNALSCLCRSLLGMSED